MSNIQLVTTFDDDIYQLSEGLHRYYLKNISHQRLNEIKKFIKDHINKQALYAYYINNQPIGYISYRLLNKHHNFPYSIFIDELFVKEKYRNKGIGKQLVKFLLKQKFDKKYQYFSVTHAPFEKYLTKFYESCGFVFNRILKSGNIALYNWRRKPINHIAIMKPEWKLTEEILNGRKTVETRWYKIKAAPWNNIAPNDIIYFKEGPQGVFAKAIVKKVIQYECITPKTRKKITNQYFKAALGNKCHNTAIVKQIKSYMQDKNFGIIIELKQAKAIKPFRINKTGYGSMASWLVGL